MGLVLLLKVKQMIIKYRIIVQSVVDFDSEAEKIQDSTKITILLKHLLVREQSQSLNIEAFWKKGMKNALHNLIHKIFHKVGKKYSKKCKNHLTIYEELDP